MTRLLQSELFRLSRRLMPRVLVLIMVGTVLLLYLVMWTAARAATEQESPEQTTDLQVKLRLNLRVGVVRDFGLTQLVHPLASILVVILSASTVGSEYGWGTIRAILPRAGGRTMFLTAKLASLGLFVLIVVVLGFLVALGASAFITPAEGLQGGLGARFLPETLAALARTVYVMLPYVAIAVAIAVLTRSGAAGIGAGLAILLIEGPITGLIGAAGGPFAWIPKLLVSANVRAIMRLNIVDPATTLTDTSNSLLSPWAAAGVLAVYTAASLGFAFWRFQSRDITSG